MNKAKTEKNHKEDSKYVIKGSLEETKKDKNEKKKHGGQEKHHKEFVPVCLNEETDSIAANKARKILKEAWIKNNKQQLLKAI